MTGRFADFAAAFAREDFAQGSKVFIGKRRTEF